MTITSATFVKGVVDADEVLEDGKPQIAFIGRSNVGKSSLINALTRVKGLARASAQPGRTQEINVFLINNKMYLIDLPGYGYSKTSWQGQQKIQNLMYWYLLASHYTQKKVVLIIDAKVGMTDNDKEMLKSLEEQGKDIIIVANKIDKIRPSAYTQSIQAIQDLVGHHTVIPISTKKHTGISGLVETIFS